MSGTPKTFPNNLLCSLLLLSDPYSSAQDVLKINQKYFYNVWFWHFKNTSSQATAGPVSLFSSPFFSTQNGCKINQNDI
jgi:hypothetical protein